MFKSWLYSARTLLVAYTSSKGKVGMFSENFNVLTLATTNPGKHTHAEFTSELCGFTLDIFFENYSLLTMEKAEVVFQLKVL